MPVSIHAIEKALFKIFCNDFVFAIPPYQRPYAWTTEQASELLSDLLSFLGTGSEAITDVNPYFLGSIVLIKGEDMPEADVVDGQQRLATLTMLLAALRALVNSNYSTQTTRFIYEEGNSILGTQNRYRLKLRERDEKFFRRYIQDEKGIDDLLRLDSAQLSDSQKNIQTNAKYFLEELKNLPEQQRVRLLQYLMARCFLVVVSTPDLDSAYRIFSILNARGLDLKLTDLLKSEIIGAIPAAQQDKYTNIWENEEEDLGRDAFQDLFAHIRMIYRKAKPRESALNEFRKHIQPQKESQKFIDEVLKPYSDSFEIIKTVGYQSDSGAEVVNSLFRWLNQIDNFDWVPPAILYLTKNLHSPDKLRHFFTDLERLAAGLMILRADINNRIERYGRLLTAIEEDADLYNPNSPLQLTPDEASQIMRTLNGDLYLIKRIRQYVLLRLDSALAQGEASYDYPIITVEHVLPQNPNKGSVWLEWFPNEEERAKYVHCIGNLALLSRKKNAEAQNYDFDKKKKKYFATSKGISPFVLTTQVLQKIEWTHDVINQRQKELLQKLKSLWRL
ncbi:MAG: DUF262 domain-containing HNH endonuclease family protein [Deltaproteobacteria bacterium]|nr:DUF262 domain-containing HNH endonuclease family protein [Deltaproteobacteria bacterium]